MTDQDQTVQDEQSNSDVLEALDIASLRKLAKMLSITAQRDWDKGAFVEAIQNKQAQASVELAVGKTNGPKPGFARILMHRDPTPGHKNTPIHVSINGRIFAIPRGVEVDVPTPIVEVLNNAVTVVTRQKTSADQRNPSGLFEDEAQMSYPFQVLQITPGDFVNTNDGRAANYERRYAFYKKIGRWPTHGELEEAMKHKIRKELAED